MRRRVLGSVAVVLALVAALLFLGGDHNRPQPRHCPHHKTCHRRDKHDKGIVPSPYPGPTPGGAVPVNAGLPTISGTTTQGQTLTEAHGTWTNTPTSYTYQWENCSGGCTHIGGATSQTYVLASGDVGLTIRVIETAVNGSGAGSPATSTATTTVGASSAPVNTVVPTISGTAQAGQTLTEAHGTWSNCQNSSCTFSYQWQDCSPSCVNIPAATSQTYAVQNTDVGVTIDVVEKATNAAGNTSATSSQTATVIAASGGPSCSPSPCNGVSTGFSSAPSYDVTANDGLNACTSGCSNTVTTTFYEAVPSHLNLTDATHPVPLVFEFSSGSIVAPTAQAWAQESGSSSGGTCTGTCAGPYAVVQMQGPYFTNGGATCCQFGDPASVSSTAVGPQGSDPKGTNSCAGTPPPGFGSTAPCDIAPTILAILSAVECHTGTPPCLNVDTSKIYFTGGSKAGQATLDAACDERTSSVGAAFGVDSDSLLAPPPVSGVASVTTATPNCAAIGQQCLYPAACTGSTNPRMRMILMSGTFDTYGAPNGGGAISPNTSACNQLSVVSGSVTGTSSAAAKTAATQNCASEGFIEGSNSWFWGHEQLAGCTLGEAGGSLLGGLGAGSPCATTTGTFNGTSATTIGGATNGLGGFLGCPQAPTTVTAFGILTANPGGTPDPGWTNAANELIYRDHAPCSNGAELATVQIGDPSANLAPAGTYVGGNHLPQGVGGWDAPTEFMKFFNKQAMP